MVQWSVYIDKYSTTFNEIQALFKLLQHTMFERVTDGRTSVHHKKPLKQ